MLFVLFLILCAVLLVADHQHGGKDDEDGNQLYPGEGHVKEEPGHDGRDYDTAGKAEGHEYGVGTGNRCLDDECVVAVEDCRVDHAEQDCQPSAREGKAGKDEGHHSDDQTAHYRKDGGRESLVTGIIVGVESGKE